MAIIPDYIMRGTRDYGTCDTTYYFRLGYTIMSNQAYPLLLATLIGLYLVIASRAKNTPIVIVPGVLGNQLEGKLDRESVAHVWCKKKSDWFTMWLSIGELVYPFTACLQDNIKLVYDPATGKYNPPKGVQTRVPGFWQTSTVEYLDPATPSLTFTQYFHDLVEHFVSKHGYVRGETIVAAPYDWRYAPSFFQEQGYYAALKQLIEDVYYANDSNTPITLLAHSMGAPTSLYFLTKLVDQAWKEKYIKNYVTLSGAWRGLAKTVKMFASGDNEGIIIDMDIWGREAQRTYPGTAWLLPYPSDTWTRDEVLVMTPDRNYTAWDYKALFQAMNYTRGYEMYEEFMNLTNGLLPPNITTYCYYGNKVDTPLTFVYGKGDFPDVDPKTINGNGDGTVNNNSLLSCERWKTQQTYSVTLKAFDNVEHVDMVKNSDVIAAVEAIAVGN